MTESLGADGGDAVGQVDALKRIEVERALADGLYARRNGDARQRCAVLERESAESAHALGNNDTLERAAEYRYSRYRSGWRIPRMRLRRSWSDCWKGSHR